MKIWLSPENIDGLVIKFTLAKGKAYMSVDETLIFSSR